MDVGSRAVYSELRTLRAQDHRVGTCAQGHQADVLAKYANTIPLNNQSLFEGGIKTMVAKDTSAARDYAALAEGFVQADLYRLKPLRGNGSCKRTYNGSLPPFCGKKRQSNSGWHNRSSSMG